MNIWHFIREASGEFDDLETDEDNIIDITADDVHISDIPAVKETKRKNREFNSKIDEELINEVGEDIPVVKESVKDKIVNWFTTNKKKHESNKEFKKTKKQMDKIEKDLTNEIEEDIPVVKEPVKDKILNWFTTNKKKHESNKEFKKTKKQMDKIEKKLIKEENKETNKISKTNNIKSTVTAVLFGALTVVSISGALIAASAVTTLGLLPTLGFTSIYVTSSLISCYMFTNEVKIIKEKVGRKVELSKMKESVNKESLVEKVSEKQENNVLKTKLSREEKIGQVKNLSIVHDSKLGVYCVPIDKEDKQLQKFIRNEYKQEYPEERIQSFETKDKKVLVLSKESKLFR